ncbi:SDR family oxidoreductase [Sorangium sp. So ce131]|uniref:SDR family oxidoreductase n=1 Tax=Sorangium sp. So ce131 TaxID=3133282 RepID=UPI003F619CE7
MTATAHRILLAGATGAVGIELLRLLRAQGRFVRTLSRTRQNAARVYGLASEVVVADAVEPGALAGVLEGITTVVSCLGASVALTLRERRSYHDVDVVANTHLLEASKRAGVKRFVYLSAHPGPGYAHTRYLSAHLGVEERIRASGLAFSFVRPTGVYTALGDLIAMARVGLGAVAGDGLARTNPVHPVDVAEALAEVIDGGPAVLPVGGPDVMTRDDVARLAFEATGKQARLLHVPPGVFRVMSALLTGIHPRLSDLLEFVAAVMTSDSVAPARGTRPLRAWFAEVAGERPGLLRRAR